jgi:hypothetical protein
MVIPLNDFSELYVGSILRGIATSLGCCGKKISINIDPEGLNLYSDDLDVQVKKEEFACIIVESTIKGMLSPLKGVVWPEKITITTRE